MTDIFEAKSASPMLIGRDEKPFDDPGCLFELKLDGERCLAYLDETGTALANRRGKMILPRLPELEGIHRQAKKRCILDGELIVEVNGKPDFSMILKRSLASHKTAVRRAAQSFPVTFVVFDILYADGRELTGLPLVERKALLEQAVVESERLTLSRYILERGVDFFALARERELEGIVGKRMDSLYYMGRRTKDWVKIKNLLDDDFVVCGYIINPAGGASLVLGQYDGQGKLEYRGHVVLGNASADFRKISGHPKIKTAPFSGPIPPGNGNAVWIRPDLMCTVTFLERTENGVRQPVYKGLRSDKKAGDAGGWPLPRF